MVWCLEDEDEDGDRGDQMHRNAVSSPGSRAVDCCECEDECEDEDEEEAQPSEDRQRRSADYSEETRVVRSSASASSTTSTSRAAAARLAHRNGRSADEVAVESAPLCACYECVCMCLVDPPTPQRLNTRSRTTI